VDIAYTILQILYFKENIIIRSVNQTKFMKQCKYRSKIYGWPKFEI